MSALESLARTNGMKLSENPYAPPHYEAVVPLAIRIPQGPVATWRTRDLVAHAFSAFGQHWSLLLGSMIVAGLGINVCFGLARWLAPDLLAIAWRDRETPDDVLIWFVSAISSTLMTFYLQIGFTRHCLAIMRSESPSFSVLFSGADRLPVMILLMTPVWVGEVLGFASALRGGEPIIAYAFFYGTTLLLLLPSVYVADTTLGPFALLARAWRDLQGNRLRYFGLLAIIVAWNLGGLLCCVVGLVATIPMAMLAMAKVYLAREERVA